MPKEVKESFFQISSEKSKLNLKMQQTYTFKRLLNLKQQKTKL